MKYRAIMFASVALLFVSIAFADNLTDAPLVTSDPYATVAPQESQEKQASSRRKQSKKKDESAPAKTKSENTSKENRQKDQSNPQYPAANGKYAGNN